MLELVIGGPRVPAGSRQVISVPVACGLTGLVDDARTAWVTA